MVLVILFSTFIDGRREFLTGILDAPFQRCHASAPLAHPTAYNWSVIDVANMSKKYSSRYYIVLKHTV